MNIVNNLNTIQNLFNLFSPENCSMPSIKKREEEISVSVRKKKVADMQETVS